MSTLKHGMVAFLRVRSVNHEACKKHPVTAQCAITVETAAQAQARKAQIDKALMDLGIPDNLLGYDYLQTAIEINLQNPEAVHKMMAFLYPAIAQYYNTKPALVERGIRYAVECGWIRCDLRMQAKYFGGKIAPLRSKPTNTEFIARVSNVIRRQQI